MRCCCRLVAALPTHRAHWSTALVQFGVPPFRWTGRPPIDDDTDVVFVPRGASFPRQLTFDVPAHSRRVTLAVTGGDQPIPLALGPAPADGHGGH
jgi:hypothetical protein